MEFPPFFRAMIPFVTSVGKRAQPLALDFESFRRQERILIVSSLVVVAVLVLVHVAADSVLGAPNRPVLATLSTFFLVLVAEFVWLQSIRTAPGPNALRLYSAASVWVALALVGTATFVSAVQDRHYAALLGLPVVTAAFRFSLAGTLGVAGVAGLLNFLEVWHFFRLHPPEHIGEYYEAFSVSLLLFLVGTLVWLLVQVLRQERVKLERSLVELKTTRDRLVTEEKLAVVGRLASAIAHEIRNPVAMIGSSLAAATTGNLAPERRDEMFRIAAAEAKRLEALTTEFLAYARPRNPDRMRSQVATLLGYVAALVRATADEKRVRVEVDCPNTLTALLDPFQMQQALLNLALNALDATPPDGRVALGASRLGGGGCELHVENEGAPIPGVDAARVFEPFFTTKPRGSGLGLAIARNIARAHGGDVLLAVNEPGLVRFVLNLPGPAEPGPELERA
jgi:signal transduction histidine kinase